MQPRYSVIIPFFNEAGNVLPLVESVSGQPFHSQEPTEILLIDDGSTDNTPCLLYTSPSPRD